MRYLGKDIWCFNVYFFLTLKDREILRNFVKDAKSLFEAEKKFTAICLHKLQENPIKRNFDFNHLNKIHKYIFQDLYDWAGR